MLQFNFSAKMESEVCIWAAVFFRQCLKKPQNDGNTVTNKIQAGEKKKIMAKEH